MIKTVILIISDKGSTGEREDKCGPLISQVLDNSVYSLAGCEIIPDDINAIKSSLSRHSGKADLILTSGGTGLSPRDVTAEATLDIIDKEIPGIPEAIRTAGMKHTDRSMLSRAVAGVRGKCLIINMPGSPNAVKESIEVILNVIPHAVEKIKGSEEECAR
ncbi:MAG: MogA/MoaB family molybdenum cofactor biosynthesis protein [Nitrospirota bacterium]|nr:MAG: MogA/MoaB family molybdenum cofactor biosynthesis protein [Nitrospirota bacterium]